MEEWPSITGVGTLRATQELLHAYHSFSAELAQATQQLPAGDPHRHALERKVGLLRRFFVLTDDHEPVLDSACDPVPQPGWLRALKVVMATDQQGVPDRLATLAHCGNERAAVVVFEIPFGQRVFTPVDPGQLVGWGAGDGSKPAPALMSLNGDVEFAMPGAAQLFSVALKAAEAPGSERTLALACAPASARTAFSFLDYALGSPYCSDGGRLALILESDHALASSAEGALAQFVERGVTLIRLPSQRSDAFLSEVLFNL